MCRQVEGRESLVAPGEDLLLHHMELDQGTISHFCWLPLLTSNREVGRLKWEVVAKDTSKDDLGWTDTSDQIRTVLVEEESTSHLVTMESFIRTHIIHDHSLCTLYADLSAFVNPPVIVR